MVLWTWDIGLPIPSLNASWTHSTCTALENLLASHAGTKYLTWPNMDILRYCGMVSLQAILKQHILCWLDHVFYMDTDCLPQQILYGKLASTKHNSKHLRLLFTDTCQWNLKLFRIHTEWEMTTSRWQLWRQQLNDGRLLYEGNQG